MALQEIRAGGKRFPWCEKTIRTRPTGSDIRYQKRVINHPLLRPRKPGGVQGKRGCSGTSLEEGECRCVEAKLRSRPTVKRENSTERRIRSGKRSGKNDPERKKKIRSKKKGGLEKSLM